MNECSMRINATKNVISMVKGSEFYVYHPKKLKLAYSKNFNQPLKFVNILNKSNIVAIVFQKEPWVLHFWNDALQVMFGNIEFPNSILDVSLNDKHIITSLNNKIYIHEFATLKLVDYIETYEECSNIFGFCPYGSLVSTCHFIKGKIEIRSYDPQYDPLIFQAHVSSISCMTFNEDGSRLASTSERGTIIRVWNTFTSELLHQFKRGSDVATIYDLCFHHSILICSSSKGTIHFFEMPKLTDNDNNNFYKFFTNWQIFNWSSMKFLLNYPTVKNKIIMEDKNKITIIFENGVMMQYEVDIILSTFQLINENRL